MNQQHRMAKAASEQSQDHFFALYFRAQPGGVPAEAVVAAVRGDGVQAWVPRFELRGPVHLRSRDGAAYVPVGGGAPAAEDAAVEIVRDDEALVARRRVGGKVGFVFIASALAQTKYIYRKVGFV